MRVLRGRERKSIDFFPKNVELSLPKTNTHIRIYFFFTTSSLSQGNWQMLKKGVKPSPIQTGHTESEESRSWGPLHKHALLQTVRRPISPHKTREQPHPDGDQKRPGGQAHRMHTLQIKNDNPGGPLMKPHRGGGKLQETGFFRSSTGLPYSFILRICSNIQSIFC